MPTKKPKRAKQNQKKPCPQCGRKVVPVLKYATELDDLEEFGADELAECPECGYVDRAKGIDTSWD